MQVIHDSNTKDVQDTTDDENAHVDSPGVYRLDYVARVTEHGKANDLFR